MPKLKPVHALGGTDHYFLALVNAKITGQNFRDLVVPWASGSRQADDVELDYRLARNLVTATGMAELQACVRRALERAVDRDTASPRPEDFEVFRKLPRETVDRSGGGLRWASTDNRVDLLDLFYALTCEAIERRHPTVARCAGCGDYYFRVVRRALFCSTACKDRAAYLRRRERVPVRRMRPRPAAIERKRRK